MSAILVIGRQETETRSLSYQDIEQLKTAIASHSNNRSVANEIWKTVIEGLSLEEPQRIAPPSEYQHESSCGLWYQVTSNTGCKLALGAINDGSTYVLSAEFSESKLGVFYELATQEANSITNINVDGTSFDPRQKQRDIPPRGKKITIEFKNPPDVVRMLAVLSGQLEEILV